MLCVSHLKNQRSNTFAEAMDSDFEGEVKEIDPMIPDGYPIHADFSQHIWKQTNLKGHPPLVVKAY